MGCDEKLENFARKAVTSAKTAADRDHARIWVATMASDHSSTLSLTHSGVIFAKIMCEIIFRICVTDCDLYADESSRSQIPAISDQPDLQTIPGRVYGTQALEISFDLEPKSYSRQKVTGNLICSIHLSIQFVKFLSEATYSIIGSD